MKNCFACGELKELSLFYKHPCAADGHLGKCKECTKKDVRANREKNKEYYQEYDRKRSSQPERIAIREKVAKRWKEDPKLRERTGELKRAWQERNALKRAAHVITGNAIQGGRLVKQPCEVCGAEKVDAHHDDYSLPLDVRWLCHRHHMEHHREERERLRTKAKA